MEVIEQMNLIFVLDVSGSMGEICRSEVSLKRLSLAKHCITLMTKILDENSTVGIVDFSDSATIVSPIRSMMDVNKEMMLTELESVTTRGCTNMTSGYQCALELIKQNNPSIFYNIIFLTDGDDNYERQKSRLIKRFVSLKNLNSENHSMTFVGFSNEIKSDLLFALSLNYESQFYYISDITMIVTVFVNIISNLRFKVTDVHHLLSVEDNNLLSRIITILVKDVEHGFISKEYSDLVDRISRMNGPLYESLYRDLADNLNPDLGQVYKSFDRRYFPTWGAHHIRAYISSLINRQPYNFKDEFPNYMLKLNEDKCHFIDSVDDIVKEVSLPKDTIVASRNIDPTIPIATAVIYNPSNGCFTGDTLFYDGDGFPKPASGFSVGDEICINNCDEEENDLIICDRIKYIIRSFSPCEVVKINKDTKLTPYHPVVINKKDMFPIDIDNCESETVSETFNFMLENGSVLETPSGVIVSTLGNKSRYEKFRHPYFGSNDIRSDFDLLGLDFLLNGVFIEGKHFTWKRSEEDNSVIGINML